MCGTGSSSPAQSESSLSTTTACSLRSGTGATVSATRSGELPCPPVEPDADPLAAAQRALREGCGLAAPNWIRIGKITAGTQAAAQVVHYTEPNGGAACPDLLETESGWRSRFRTRWRSVA